MPQLRSWLVLLLLISGLVFPPRASAAPREVNFVRDIQPLFESACYECHGPSKQKGKLRLDSKALALAGGNTGALVIPGDGGRSYLVKRLLGEGDEDRMPLKHDPLSADQIAIVRAWIDQGAKWPDSASVSGAKIAKHWAYEKPVRPETPAVKNIAWVRNPIDAFVLARLEKEGLAPSPEAQRTALIRRVYLDVVGLLPSPAEVDAFVADTSGDAYEKVVDRLLASPHYGERWGRHWLDLARYADTNGYEKDRPRSIWPYRDWVIDAVNRDLPFDQFTIEQIAGDMLPNATAQQKIATGFHRNTMINEEGGIDVEEFRYKAVVDRVQTTATAWLGMTLQCAQCHNHKYEPITQKEYFQFFALLNGADETTLDVPDETIAAQRKEIEAKIEKAETALEEKFPVGTEPADASSHAPEGQRRDNFLKAKLEEWEHEVAPRCAHWTVLNPVQFSRNYDGTIVKLPDPSLLFTGDNLYRDLYKLQFECDLSGVTSIRLEVLPDDRLEGGGPGRNPAGGFILHEFNLFTAPADHPENATTIELSGATADFASRTSVTDAIDGKNNTGWTIDRGDGKSHVAVFQLKQPLTASQGSRLLVHLLQNYHQQENIGRLRLSATTDAGPVVTSGLPADVEQIVLTPTDHRTIEQQARLRTYFLSVTPLLASARKEIVSLRASLPKYSTTLVMQDRPFPRVTHVYHRGEFLQPKQVVEPDVPRVLHPLLKDAPRNRLTLARWLVDPENPLVGRVMMNRTWATYFGRGIVGTVEDLGVMAEKPSNPELLDWLATELPRRGWSMKAMHRLIVTSATYRQSAKVTPALLVRDPNNELLARGPRVRVEAEIVRDIALSASGLLSETIGGPSVYPPQPPGVAEQSWDALPWPTSTGPNRFRRGMYTFLRRTAPYPGLTTFDAPTSELTCARRLRSNTPLQALTILNDTVFVEAAQAMARRVMTESPDDTTARARLAFRLCLCRDPQPRELEQIVKFYRTQIERFRAAPHTASTVAVSNAVKPRENADITELAAWTVVSRVILNLDETITK